MHIFAWRPFSAYPPGGRHAAPNPKYFKPPRGLFLSLKTPSHLFHHPKQTLLISQGCMTLSYNSNSVHRSQPAPLAINNISSPRRLEFFFPHIYTHSLVIINKEKTKKKVYPRPAKQPSSSDPIRASKTSQLRPFVLTRRINRLKIKISDPNLPNERCRLLLPLPPPPPPPLPRSQPTPSTTTRRSSANGLQIRSTARDGCASSASARGSRASVSRTSCGARLKGSGWRFTRRTGGWRGCGLRIGILGMCGFFLGFLFFLFFLWFLWFFFIKKKGGERERE